MVTAFHIDFSRKNRPVSEEKILCEEVGILWGEPSDGQRGEDSLTGMFVSG